jgi:uncharacterized damage-inducible protein DinB
MTIGASMLPEFDQEMATTRRVLQGVADSKLAWRPHPKSWTMAGLATHVANLPAWAPLTIERDSLDIAPVGAPPPRVEEARSAAELVTRFDENAAAARAAIAGASDATMLAPWTLEMGGKKVFSLPRVAVLRAFVMNHMIHHRGQLALYFRIADLPVPSTYGPTADGPAAFGSTPAS